jgi:hypothetical protein
VLAPTDAAPSLRRSPMSDYPLLDGADVAEVDGEDRVGPAR